MKTKSYIAFCSQCGCAVEYCASTLACKVCGSIIKKKKEHSSWQSTKEN